MTDHTEPTLKEKRLFGRVIKDLGNTMNEALAAQGVVLGPTDAERRERRLRRAVAKTGHSLHRRRGIAANWSSRPWYISRDYDNTVVGYDMSIDNVEIWVDRLPPSSPGDAA